ncbi:MAG: hypothetical protein KAI59_03400 [Planctomycetes bacterium]|nr:hypothetical protein [Planctomycetota bacterium]
MTRSGEDNYFRANSLSCIIAFMLFAASAANASLTVTHQDATLTTICPADLPTPSISTVDNTVKPVHTQLTNIGAEFLQPPETPAGLLNAHSNSIRSLPAVPATILMLLTGLLCISLYRDRKVWLVALMGLLWVGHAGIQTFPRFACHFSYKNHTKQQICAELAYPHYLENSHRLRNDVEGTWYVGLLRHLGGIPGNKSVIISQLAIVFGLDSQSSLFHRLAFNAEQLSHFSLAFVSDNLVRGPPFLAWKFV